MTPKQEQEFNKLISKLTVERFNEHYIFLKQILISSSAIFAIFVSFGKFQIETDIEYYSFVSTVSLLGLSILLGVGVQYGKVVHLVDTVKEVQRVEKLLYQQDFGITIRSLHVPFRKFYVYLGRVYYPLFCLSICSIVIFCILVFR